MGKRATADTGDKRGTECYQNSRRQLLQSHSLPPLYTLVAPKLSTKAEIQLLGLVFVYLTL